MCGRILLGHHARIDSSSNTKAFVWELQRYNWGRGKGGDAGGSDVKNVFRCDLEKIAYQKRSEARKREKLTKKMQVLKDACRVAQFGRIVVTKKLSFSDSRT